MKSTRYNPDLHNRKSIRLPNYDYSGQGFYFVTICCHEKQYLFGNITNGKMLLNELGFKTLECWTNIPIFYPQVRLHDFIIMPNHVHGIIEITRKITTNAQSNNHSPSQTRPTGTSQTIGAMVRGFKSAVTSWARNHTSHYQIWQRNYHEHIIRNEQSYLHIAKYIRNNPLSWELDCFYDKSINNGF